MKTGYFIIIILCIPLFSISQDTNDTIFARHVLKTYPSKYALWEINLGYEYVIGPRTSIEIIGGWNYKDFAVTPVSFSYHEKPEIKQITPPIMSEGSEYPKLFPCVGGSLSLNYRYYFSSRRPMPLGAFMNAQLMYKLTYFSDIYSSREYGTDSMNITKHAITLKFLFGGQYQLFKKISLSYYLGAGVRYQPEKATRFYYCEYNMDTELSTENKDNTTIIVHYFTPTIHISIGVGYFF